jgi:hypothetical protein
MQQQLFKNADSSQVYEDFMVTPVGQIQSEFLTMLDKEIEKTADFYILKTRKGIRDCNSIL